MMREILFRGKRPNRNEWLEGSLLFYPDVNRAFVSLGEYKGIGGFFEVKKNTVGQFTGLTDKNGKKIFEGDIVIVDLILNPKKYVGVVVYNKDCFGVDIKGITPVQNCLAYSKENGEIEVVGNIYDNPELVERRCFK